MPVPGDVIILANGVYTTTANITITKQGTVALPITIQAQSILGAEIQGSYGFTVNSPARYIIITGSQIARRLWIHHIKKKGLSGPFF